MLTIDTKQVDELLRTLRLIPKELEKTSTRAINKSLISTRAFMVKTVREEYAIKAKDVRGALNIKKANWHRLSGNIRGSGKPGIPLLAFVNGSKNAPSTRRLKSGAYRPKVGIPVLIRKNRGRIAARGVFLARMRSGHIGAFRNIGGRSSTGQQKIKEAYGPSPIKILSGDKYERHFEKFAGESMKKNLLHEADRSLKKIGLR